MINAPMQKYSIYGFFRKCELCKTEEPLAVGITHDGSALRLIRHRCLRRQFTPQAIRDFPGNYEIRIINKGLEWGTAYLVAELYKGDGMKVLTCSRT